MRSKSIALVFERSGGGVAGEVAEPIAGREDIVDVIVGRGEAGAELGRRGDGSVLLEDLGLGGVVGLGVGECESGGDMARSGTGVQGFDDTCARET